jgi:hypothetical protein
MVCSSSIDDCDIVDTSRPPTAIAI